MKKCKNCEGELNWGEEGLLEFTDKLRIRLPEEARKKYSEVE
jgi:hypothetical protein